MLAPQQALCAAPFPAEAARAEVTQPVGGGGGFPPGPSASTACALNETFRGAESPLGTWQQP